MSTWTCTARGCPTHCQPRHRCASGVWRCPRVSPPCPGHRLPSHRCGPGTAWHCGARRCPTHSQPEHRCQSGVWRCGRVRPACPGHSQPSHRCEPEAARLIPRALGRAAGSTNRRVISVGGILPDLDAHVHRFVDGFVDGVKRSVPGDLKDTVIEIARSDPEGFMTGLGTGYFSGLWAGIKGLLDSLMTAGQLALVVSPPNLLRLSATEGVSLLTDETHRELRRRDVESVAKVVVKAFVQMTLNPNYFLDRSELAGAEIGRHLANEVVSELTCQDAERLGAFVGNIYGQVAFEVLIEIILAGSTGGAGNTARAGVVAGQATRGAGRFRALYSRLRASVMLLPGMRRVAEALEHERQTMRHLARSERGELFPAVEVTLSKAEYLAALRRVFPGDQLHAVQRLIDNIGQRAAAVAARDPEFLRLVARAESDPNLWSHVGNRFHVIAADVAKQMGNNPTGLPPGWSLCTELTIQSKLGGSRSDLLLRGPSGEMIEIDWKTTGRSGLASISQMRKHAAQMANSDNRRDRPFLQDTTLEVQESRSWLSYIRTLLPDRNWPR